MADPESISTQHILLQQHRQTLAIYLRQLASLGANHAPPVVHNGIAEARAAIAAIKAWLREQGEHIDDAPGDNPMPEETIQADRPARPISQSVVGGDRNIQAIDSTVVSTFFSGDQVAGDKVGGDKVMGDKFVVLPGAPALSVRERRDSRTLIDLVRQSWIAGVLEQSLWSKARLELPLLDRPTAVRRPYSLHERGPEGEHPLPTTTPIAEIYAQSAGALLILGAPGAGKTTLLLELANTLLIQADAALANPTAETPRIPVVFNLSSWARGRLPLANWLARELNEQYGVSKKLARRWLDAGTILPLLDALDEVDADVRAACAEAINVYRQDDGGLQPMVVSCRDEEYQKLPQLRMQRAVVAQSLSREEIERVLEDAQGRLSSLRAAIEQDATLWELLDTPLMLSVAALAFEDQLALTLERGDEATRHRSLFDVYVKRMMVRKPPHPRYINDVLLSYLSWLAAQMKSSAQSEFQVEGLQFDLLSTSHLSLLLRILMGLIVGPGVGLSIGFILGPIFGLIGGLLVVLSGGMGSGIAVDLLFSLIFGLLFGVTIAMIVGIGGGVVGGLRFGLQTEIGTTERISWHWRRTFSKNGLFFGVFSGLFFALVWRDHRQTSK